MDELMWQTVREHLSSIERKVDTFHTQHHEIHQELNECLRQLTDITSQHERNWTFVGWVWKGFAWVVGTAATLAGLWGLRAVVLYWYP